MTLMTMLVKHIPQVVSIKCNSTGVGRVQVGLYVYVKTNQIHLYYIKTQGHHKDVS